MLRVATARSAPWTTPIALIFSPPCLGVTTAQAVSWGRAPPLPVGNRTPWPPPPVAGPQVECPQAFRRGAPNTAGRRMERICCWGVALPPAPSSERIASPPCDTLPHPQVGLPATPVSVVATRRVPPPATGCDCVARPSSSWTRKRRRTPRPSTWAALTTYEDGWTVRRSMSVDQGPLLACLLTPGRQSSSASQ